MLYFEEFDISVEKGELFVGKLFANQVIAESTIRSFANARNFNLSKTSHAVRSGEPLRRDVTLQCTVKDCDWKVTFWLQKEMNCQYKISTFNDNHNHEMSSNDEFKILNRQIPDDLKKRLSDICDSNYHWSPSQLYSFIPFLWPEIKYENFYYNKSDILNFMNQYRYKMAALNLPTIHYY